MRKKLGIVYFENWSPFFKYNIVGQIYCCLRVILSILK